MATDQIKDQLSCEDQRLVRLVTVDLANPRMPLDVRARLHEKLTWLLTVALVQAPVADPPMSREPGAETDPDGVAHLLESVLTDPTTHTETRMRLHDEIAELLEPADD